MECSMSDLRFDPQCEHEKVGRVYAHSFSTAANAIHILELAGGKIDGLNIDQWRSIRASYQAEMDANLLRHRAECEGDASDR